MYREGRKVREELKQCRPGKRTIGRFAAVNPAAQIMLGELFILASPYLLLTGKISLRTSRLSGSLSFEMADKIDVPSAASQQITGTETMKIEFGDWCLYPWFMEHGISLLHPGDVDAFRELVPSGKVFQCIGTDGPFIVLMYKTGRYRVLPELAKPIPSPRFSFGDVVLLGTGEDANRGIVREIFWHFGKNEPFFLLEVEGRKKSRRYWADELAPG